ncbi:MAG: SRPBCC family protein [Anaerolineae bacterium]
MSQYESQDGAPTREATVSTGSMYLPRPERSAYSTGSMSRSERDLYTLLGVLLIGFGMMRRGAAWFAIPAGIYTAIKGLTGRGLFDEPTDRSENHAGSQERARPEAVSVPHEQGVHVSHSITIHRDATDIYAALKNPETLEAIVPQLDSVTMADPDHGRWTVRLPGGIPVTSEIEIVNEQHGEVIGWRSVNSPVAHAGAIRFTASSRGGTRVRVEAEYQPPAGVIGIGAAMILGLEPSALVKEALHNLKLLMETGSVGSPSKTTRRTTEPIDGEADEE